MPCVCQSNREFTHASTQIYVWRQTIRVGARADGTDLYRKQGFAGVMRCCNEVGAGMFAEADAAYRLYPERPGYSARGAWRDESTAATSLVGIVLEFCGKPFAHLPPLIRPMRGIVHDAGRIALRARRFSGWRQSCHCGSRSPPSRA